MKEEFEVSHFTTDKGQFIDVYAGRREVIRSVPPAGEAYAHDIQKWERKVQIYVSPQGRSVRVFVDGEEVVKKRGE